MSANPAAPAIAGRFESIGAAFVFLGPFLDSEAANLNNARGMNRGHLFHLVILAAWLFLAPHRIAAQMCPQLSGTFATQQTGTTSGSSAEAGSCGGAGAPEKSFVFAAPRAGVYSFDTIGSGFDTVLYVRDDNGTQLGCNDDIAAGINTQSRLSVTLAQAQTVTVFVDGFEAQSGNFSLRVNPDCPLPFRNDARDLGHALSVSVSATTTCAANFIGGASCGGPSGGSNGGAVARDAIFLYTAPSDGTYTISTEGSNFDTVLYVRLGTCSGTELGCNDDIAPGSISQSRLTRWLTSGQTIIIAVDGYADESGDYILSIVGNPATPTITATATRTRTPTLTPTITVTSTITPTPTITATLPPTNTPTVTRTLTSTRTPTRTTTQTATLTPTVTRTSTSTRTRSITPTDTPGPSATPTISPIATASPTITVTAPPPTPTSTLPPSPTQVVTGPGCCQRFLPAAVCEGPVSLPGCTQSGGVFVANASCIRGLCVSNDPTVTATPADSPTVIATSTPTQTRPPTVTQSPSPSSSPTPTTPRAFVLLASSSGVAGDPLFVNGHVARGAAGARIYWKFGAELQSLLEVVAAADGSFEAVATIPAAALPGNAQVCAAASGVAARGADIACARFTVIPAEPGGIAGQVVGEDGAPLADSDVFLGDERAAPLARATTDGNGQYDFRDLVPGNYVVHVIHDGSAFEAITRQVPPAHSVSILHRATSSPSALVARSGAIAFLTAPTYTREPINSYWLARFGSLPGGPELMVRFFANVSFVSDAPGALAFSFWRGADLLFSNVVLTPAPVGDADPELIGDAYFIDVNVSDLPAGDLTLRIARYDPDSGTEIETLEELHVAMVDLGSRWLSGRVNAPSISIDADGERIAYRFTGMLPHPDFAFDFNQDLALDASATPLENHVRLDARIDETYFNDDTWRGRVVGQEQIRLLGVDLVGAGDRTAFAGPVGAEFVSSEYFLTSSGATTTGTCPTLPAASLVRPFAFNACIAGCPLTSQTRPAVASCPALTISTVAAVAPDLAVTAGVASDNARRRRERTALDTPVCRGFIDTDPEQALGIGVRYEPDAGVCPADCAFFDSLCVDLTAPAHGQIRCLTKTVDAADILLDGARVGCEAARRSRVARAIGDGSDASRPKDVASDGAGHAMLVWVEDAGTPAALLSSYFDGATWTAPQALSQSALVDSPQVAFLGPDRAIAVWEQSGLSAEEADAASLQQLLASTELYTSEWNGSTWSTPVAITNDTVADAHPSLASFPATQSAIVAWTRANAIAGQPALVVSYSLLDGSSWTPAARVAVDSIGLDYGPVADFDSSGHAAVVFTRDLDRNPATVTDRTLVFSTLSGHLWSTGEAFGPGYTPSLAFSAADEPIVALVRPTQDAGPSTQATGEGNRSQLYVARRRQGIWGFAPVASRVFAEQPLVRVSSDNHALIAFRQFDAATAGGLGTTLSAASADLNQAEPSWSTGTLDLQNTWLHAFDLDRETNTAIVAATQQGASITGVSVGDAAIEVSILPLAPRLALRSAIPSDSHPLVDDVIDLAVEVVNRGLGPLPEAVVVAAIANGSEVGTFTIPQGLGFGAIATAMLSYRITEGGVQHVVFSAGDQVIGEIAFGYPAAPANLSGFLSPASAQPELSWDEAGRGIRSYRIYRDHPGGAPSSFGELIGETQALRFTDATADAGRTQRYAVRSVDDYGVESVDIATVTVAVPGNPCAGDCDGDGVVTIDEAVLATAMANGSRPPSACHIRGAAAAPSIEAVVGVIDRALAGCQ